jgi:hypothetical protein
MFSDTFMVRKSTPFVNYTFIYSTTSKGVMWFSHSGGKSGHPQVHEVWSGGLWNEIQVNKIKINGGRYRG